MKHPDFYTGRLGNRLFQIAYLYSQVRDGVISDWYLQRPQYFEKYLSELRDVLGEGIGSLPYTAIHLRAGQNPVNPEEPSYGDNPFYVNLRNTDYYTSAMAMFPEARFLVFSDNIEIAKDYFQGSNFEFDQDNEVEAFNKMASCQNIIIANSSFSYWAALLGNPHKTVVAPSVSKWYADGNNERTVCPSHWIRI
jgi:hypothetical protein